MKKTILFVAMALVIIGMMGMLPPESQQSVRADPPPPSDDVNGTYVQYIQGDWIVTGAENYTDEIIVLDGNLTVENGGVLILRNVTLSMNCTTSDGQYIIKVEDGGTLIISDKDFDPSTPEDMSNITDAYGDTDDGGAGDYAFCIQIWDGATFKMNNTNVRETGYADSYAHGLWVDTDYTDIQNCTFVNSNWGTMFWSHFNTIAYNTYYNCTTGLQVATSCSNNLVYNNTASRCDNGLYIQGSYNTVFNNYAHNCTNIFSSNQQRHGGLRLENLQHSEIYNNRLEYCGGWWYQANLVVSSCNDLYIHNNNISYSKSLSTGIYSTNSDRINISYNSIRDALYAGSQISVTGSSGDVVLYKNNFTGNDNFAVRAQGSGSPANYFEMKDNELWGNSYGIRLYDLTSYTVVSNYINGGWGSVEVWDGSGGIFANNTIENSTEHFEIRENNAPYGDMQFNITNCYFNLSRITFYTTTGNPRVNIQNYLSVQALDVQGEVPYATVVVKNATGGTVYNVKTDINGRIDYLPITNLSIWVEGPSIENITSYDPHNVTGDYDGTPGYCSFEPVMNQTRNVTVLFGTDLIPLPPSDLTAVSQGKDVFLNWTGSSSPDIDYYLVFRNDTMGGWEIIYNSSNDPGNETATNWTDINGASDWSTYLYNVTVVDKGGQQSDFTNIARCGEWVIDGPQTVADMTIIMNGSVTILSSGELTLQNVTLIFNCSSPSEFGIDAESGATLTITDNDNDPLTTYDQSTITAINPSNRFTFDVDESDLIIKNSRFSDCANGKISGGNVSIENNEFNSCQFGARLEQVNDARIVGNTFTDCGSPIYINSCDNITISNNVMYDSSQYVITIRYSSNNTVANNEIVNQAAASAGIYVGGITSFNNTISNNNINGADQGVYLDWTGGNNRLYNIAINDTSEGIYIDDTFSDYFHNISINNTSNRAIYIRDSSFITIYNATIDKSYEGFHFQSVDNVVISDIDVLNVTESAIQAYWSTDLYFSNMTIKSDFYGTYFDECDEVYMDNVVIETCRYGIWAEKWWNSPAVFYQIKDCDILNATTGAIYLDTIDEFHAYDCNINTTNWQVKADVVDISGIDGIIRFYNCTFNESKLGLDDECILHVYWRLYLYVEHWGGGPCANADVKIKDAFGVIAYLGTTGADGWAPSVYLKDRVYYSTYNISHNPHIIDASFGLHTGTKQIFMDVTQTTTIVLGNGLPTASGVQIIPAGATTTDDLDMSYSYNDPDLDAEGATIIRWYVNGTLEPSFDNVTIINSSFTSKGQTWTCEVTPHDGVAYGNPSNSIPVTIKNTAPVATNVQITEVNPTSSDELHITYTFYDIDGDGDTRTLRQWWYNDSSGWTYSGVDNVRLSESYTTKGEQWKCIITPGDWEDYGIHVESNIVYINNSPPIIKDARIDPNSPLSSDTLVANYEYFDVDSDPESGTSIRWYKDDVEQWNLNDSISVNDSFTQKGENWYYIVTPNDGIDFGIPWQSNTINLKNTPPSVTNITISPPDPNTESELICDYEFNDYDGDTESLDTVVRWLRWNGVEFFDTGLRGKTLPSGHTTKGEVWMCQVIPHDGYDEGNPTLSDMNVTILNSAPSILFADIQPQNPDSVTDLQAGYQYYDPDSDPENGSIIQWYMNAIEQIDLNGSLTVSSSRTVKGDIWYFIITPSDGEEFGTPLQSVSVTIGNTPPSVSNILISPLTPKTGDDLTVSYDFFDIDGDTESLDTIVKWLRWTGSDFFDTGHRGKTLSSQHTSKGEIWTCEVIPHDGEDEGLVNQSDMNVTIINTAPTVLSADITPPDSNSLSDISASYLYYDVDSDAENNSLISWYRNGIEQVGLAGNFTINESYTVKGDVWYYIITPYDGEEFGTPFISDSIVIGNAPPSVSNIAISPLIPDTKDDLTASYDYYDPDGDPESLDTVVKWLRWTGSDFFDTGHRGKTLSSQHTSKGETWMCEVIPHDGEDEGPADSSDMNVTIINSAPSVLSAEISPSSPTSLSNLTASYDYYDVDSDAENGSLISWYRNGIEQVGLAGNFTINGSYTLKGEVWYYVITPSDGETFGTPVLSSTILIGNTPPSVSNITVSPLNPDTEDDLTASYDYFDTDGDSESLDTVVKWLRWSGSDFFDTGHRGKTLSSQHTSKGETWMCEVVPHDGEDEGAVNISDMNVTIINSPPTLITADITPANPTSLSNITASYIYYDVDSDAENGSLISWFRNGIEQLGLSGEFTFNASYTLKGDLWYYIITPSDGEEFGTPVQSATIVIGNTPPEVSNIMISPSNPDTEDDLTVTYDYFDTDGDSESLDTVVKWLRWSGSDFFDTGHRGQTLSYANTAKGEIWTCEVVPHDGEDEGVVNRSDMNVTIINSAPSVLSADINPPNPTSLSNITASYIYFDVDADAENGSVISWFRNGIEQLFLYGLFTFNGSYTLKGDMWYYVITPSDGEVFGTSVQSASIVIGNTPPSVSNIIISPVNPDTEDDLTVTYDYFDTDGDSESLDTVVKWLRWSGSDFFDTGHRGKTLSSANTAKGEKWTCEVVPHDGENEGTATPGDMNVTIGNSAPLALSAIITPSSPSSVSDLNASYVYWDIDSDPESGSLISWYKNGMEQLDLNGNFSVNFSKTLRGETWYYIITPSDGDVFGTPVQSASIVIGNTPPSVSNITIAPVNPDTEDDLTVSYDYYDVDGDLESFDTVVRWLRWSGTDFFDSGHRGKTLSSANTAKGEIWTCEVIPHDGTNEGSATPGDMNVTIGNSAPSVLSAVITPSNPIAVDDISASYDYYDVDSDLESGSLIAWFRNGVEQLGLAGNTMVDSTNIQKGASWYYVVTPSDGEDYGVPVQSVTIIIGNTPPQVSNIAISPLNPTTLDDLAVSYDFYDIDGDTESLDTTVKWLRWSGIDFIDTGYRGKTLSSSHTSKDETWTCEVIPHDGEDEGTATQSGMDVTVINSAPEASLAVVTPSDPTSDESLLADYDYSDVDSDTESGSIIRWYSNGLLQTNLNDSYSVNASLTQKGELWYYIITPFDGEDYGSPLQSDYAVIGNTPPQVFNIAISPLYPTTQSDLTVSYDFFDSDGDAEGLDTIIRWLRWSGTDFVDTGLRGMTLSSSNTQKGELWTCEVIPHDGLEAGSTVQSSNTVTILNSEPSVSDVRITPDNPTTAQALYPYYEYSDLDDDPELGSEIRWFRNGLHITQLDNQFTVPYTMTAKGQIWNFSMRPSDNYDYGNWAESESITIQNNPPYAMNLTISPNPPLGDESFTAYYIFFDDDGDTESGYEIRWYKNGIYQTLFDDMVSVDSAASGKGELWYFSLRVFDGEDWSNGISSHYVTIENSKPVVDSLQPTPGQIVINEMESAEFLVEANDPDGDLLLYKWRLDRTSVSDDVYYLFAPDYDGAGTYTLNLTIQDVGEKSYTLAYEWEIVVNNVNRNPQLDVLEPLTKESKMMEDTSLRFRIDESDPDAEDTLDITWYFDDVVAQEGGSSYTYHADFAAAGDHVVRAVVEDGTDSAEYSWNVSVENVEEIGRETLLGQSYDWWGLVLAILSGVAAMLLALIGLMRVRRKKGALKKYMAEIDELSRDTTLSPEEFEDKLSDIEARVNDEFRQGLIEDLHYLMLQDLIASKRGEARKAEVTSKFGRLPVGVVRDLDNMLKDGKITPEEYEGFVAMISMTESLTTEEKDELSKVIEKWGAEDDDITSQDSQSVKDKIIKDELDEILDDTESPGGD